MSIEIDILNGDASWPMAKPLFDAVWPPEVVAKLPWAGIMFAHAELRVLVQAESEDVVCHAARSSGTGASFAPAGSAAC
jgi:hypothetical protein